MADIQLRFDKDLLVLSTTMDEFFRAHGFDPDAERDYAILCEPELIEEEFRLESLMRTPIFVTPTEAITANRLAQERFEGRAVDVAAAAFAEAARFKPQHVIGAVGPSGLPLDPSSAASLKQSRNAYRDAVQALATQPFDALGLFGFTNLSDLQCALMGARSVYDGPLFTQIAVESADQRFEDGRDLAAAAAFMAEYGADVVGAASSARPDEFARIARCMREGTDKPLSAQVQVARFEKRYLNPPTDNPYYQPDTLLPLVSALHEAGVQFLRAGGNATPAYTSVLDAACEGLDVRRPAQDAVRAGGEA